MDLVSDRCTVVLLGAWNTSIFTPIWMKDVLTGPLATNVQFGPRLAVRFVTEAVAVEVSDARLVVSAQGQLSDVFPIAASLADRLPETPVSAIGVNLRYRGARTGVASTLASSIDEAVTALERECLERGVVWTLRPDPALEVEILRLSFELDAGDFGTLDFNYHRSATKMPDCQSVLTLGYDPFLADAKSIASKLLEGDAT